MLAQEREQFVESPPLPPVPVPVFVFFTFVTLDVSSETLHFRSKWYCLPPFFWSALPLMALWIRLFDI